MSILQQQLTASSPALLAASIITLFVHSKKHICFDVRGKLHCLARIHSAASRLGIHDIREP